MAKQRFELPKYWDNGIARIANFSFGQNADEKLRGCVTLEGAAPLNCSEANVTFVRLTG
jgi:hypothetical protein